MTVASMCQYWFGFVARMPTFGFARLRGRRHPRSVTFLDHVETDAKTRRVRWAKRARVVIGMCRYSFDVTISFMVASSSRSVESVTSSDSSTGP